MLEEFSFQLSPFLARLTLQTERAKHPSTLVNFLSNLLLNILKRFHEIKLEMYLWRDLLGWMYTPANSTYKNALQQKRKGPQKLILGCQYDFFDQKNNPSVID